MSVAGVLEQRGGDAREPAADRRDVKIKQVCCRGEGATKGSTRPFDRGKSNGVARGMGVGGGRGATEIFAGVAGESPRACPGDGLGSGCHGFQAAVAATGARVIHAPDLNVADMTRVAGRTAHSAPLNDESAADAG